MYSKEWYQKNKESIKKAREKYRKTEKGKKSNEKTLYGVSKKIIFKRDNYECQSCGSKNKLVIHHIDGNGSKHFGRVLKKSEKNNNLKNLITLCNSCHHKIEEWKRMFNKWSFKFDKCIMCGTNKKPHFGRGMCSRCYELTRKKYKSEWYQKRKYQSVDKTLDR